MNIEIANKLVELRKARGLSQEELAERMGVSRQAVSKWERAESSPDTDNLIALARLYGVSLDALLLGSAPDSGAAATQAEPVAELPHYADYAEQQANREWMEAERKRRRQTWLRFPYPVFVVLCYLVAGFWFGWWHPGWLMFLTIPIYYGMASGI